ncbi:MAG: heterodisulfide reductase subunit F [Candidatus Aegiribacteria sp.]|nr:heterodisulfide reductase subunit F [Candidatus Aegiribacteria sp.]
MKNLYLPIPMKVENNHIETEDRNIKTLTLSFLNNKDEETFNFIPGQFVELSVLGAGEAPFGIASSPMDKKHLDFSVSRVGLVTTELHNLDPGDTVGMRGPLGNGYPLEKLRNGNVLIIGGGFGFSTLRAFTNFILHPQNRKQYKDIAVVYGARNPGLLLYRNELSEWEQRSDVQLHVTVDKGGESWEGKTGVVPVIVKELSIDTDNTTALVCGPPVMIKFTLPVLAEMGLAPEQIFLSLEMKMKCGIGKCGRCNIGSKYVCTDGPVFNLAQLNLLPQEY